MDTTKPRNAAQERWLILRNALLKKKPVSEVSHSSIRIHNSLDLFTVERHQSKENLDNKEWFEYTLRNVVSEENASISALIRRPSSKISLEDLQVADNTGNICIWASEQAMSRYLINNLKLFPNSSVIELGGGYSCLAGVLLAKYGSLQKMFLTDGDENAVNNVKEISLHNKLPNTEVLHFKWNNVDMLSRNAGTFDYVLASDCTFRDDQRMPLVTALNILLKMNGEGIIFSPKRGVTLNDFVLKAQSVFGKSNVSVIDKYDDNIWNSHMTKLGLSTYNPELHFPIFVRIRKK